MTDDRKDTTMAVDATESLGYPRVGSSVMEYLVVVGADTDAERVRHVRARSAEEAMDIVTKALGLAPGVELRFLACPQRYPRASTGARNP